MYLPDQGSGDENMSFSLVDGVTIYGGFLPGATSLDERDWQAHPTMLSGDLYQNDAGFNGNDENSLHVIDASFTGPTAVLDGVVIEHGPCPARPRHRTRTAGGLLCLTASPTIRNCFFQWNYSTRQGAGAYLWHSSPRFENCEFVDNEVWSTGEGAALAISHDSNCIVEACLIHDNRSEHDFAIYVALSQPVFSNSIIRDNRDCGAVELLDAAPTIVNCLITGNTTGTYGGAIYARADAQPHIINSTIVANDAYHCGGIYSSDSSIVKMTNTIVWG